MRALVFRVWTWLIAQLRRLALAFLVMTDPVDVVPVRPTCGLCGAVLGPRALKTHEGYWRCPAHKGAN
jgi:hypothetical protein